MTPIVFAAIALSSAAWSTFDLSRKKLAAHLSPVPAVIWLMLLQTPVFLALAAYEPWRTPESSYWAPAALSIVLNIFANVCFIEAVHLAPLSLAIPMLSLTPVFTSCGAFVMLGEPTTARQAIGIAIIVASAFWLGRSGASEEVRESEGESVRETVGKNDVRLTRKGMLLMAFVALLWATTPVLDKMCLRLVAPSEHAFIQCLGIAIALFAWTRVRGTKTPLSELRGSLLWLVVAVVAASIALFSQFGAIQYVPVGIFEALKRAFGLLASLTLGFLVFREPINRLKIAMVIVMGAGIFVLLA